MFDSEIVENTEVFVINFVSRKLVYRGTLNNVSPDRKELNKPVVESLSKSIELIDKEYKDHRKEITKKAA